MIMRYYDDNDYNKNTPQRRPSSLGNKSSPYSDMDYGTRPTSSRNATSRPSSSRNITSNPSAYSQRQASQNKTNYGGSPTYGSTSSKSRQNTSRSTNMGRSNRSTRTSNNFSAGTGSYRSSSKSSGGFSASSLINKRNIIIASVSVGVLLLVIVMMAFNPLSKIGGGGGIFGGGGGNNPNYDNPKDWGLSDKPTVPSDPNMASFEVTPDLWTPKGSAMPGPAKTRLEKYLSRSDFEELFPNRYGMGQWFPNPESQPRFDYYSYDNLLQAISTVANIVKITAYRDNGGGQLATYAPRNIVLHKNNGTKAYIVSQHEDFDAEWNLNKPIVYQVVDMGDFLNHPKENDNKRELATMLAHMTQETSGGSTAVSIEDRITKGLWFIEETSFAWGGIGYVDYDNKTYPPTPGKSYHGRGPKQLSWNYNYGLFSDLLFLDKHVLLDRPEMLVEDGIVGYETAIAFYMTPQDKKASMHQVIDSDFKFPDPNDAKRFTPGFGLTIIIINGGLEGNLTESDPRIATRAGAYRSICARNGADIKGEKCDTAGMGAWT